MFLRNCLFLLLTAGTILANHNFNVINRCNQLIQVGILNNPGHALPLGGGFTLLSGYSQRFQVPRGWAGRMWPRTGCDQNGNNCQTGSCGNRIQCNGAGGHPPASLVEITLNGYGGKDFYDVSFVDGFNIPVTMRPVGRGQNGHYDCGTAGCRRDLNQDCPSWLRQVVGGRTVGCKSACVAFNTDQYCCRGAFNRPQTCRSSHWPVNFPKFFKDRCPDAYSYAYDDVKSTFTCTAGADYEVVLCP